MPDVMSKAQRSRLMSLVRSRNTRFELQLLRLLSAELYPLGYRYRKHCRSVFGTPDVVFHRYRVAVFLDSDFWHGRNYKKLAPRMSPFWCRKIERNIVRDRAVNRALRREGWVVLRFGETLVKKRPMSVVRRIRTALEREGRGSSTRSTVLEAGVRSPRNLIVHSPSPIRRNRRKHKARTASTVGRSHA